MTLAICFGGLALCGFAMVLLYGHELRRMARFLRNRDGRSNSRLTTEMPGPGFVDLARAVNGTLDAADRRERERASEQRQFQRDLASLSHDIRTPLMGAKGYVSLAVEEPDDARRAHYLQAAEARLADMEGLLDALFAYARATDAASELDRRPLVVLPVLADVLTGQFPAFVPSARRSRYSSRPSQIASRRSGANASGCASSAAAKNFFVLVVFKPVKPWQRLSRK